MNRTQRERLTLPFYVPRRRGDEPDGTDHDADREICSPQARG